MAAEQPDPAEGTYEFTVAMHGRRPGEIVYVAASDRPGVEPLVEAGFLIPLWIAAPEPESD